MKTLTFKRLFIALFIFIILIIFTISVVLTKLKTDIDKELVDIKSHLGKNVIIKKDTLMIIDYSIMKNSYILENGVEVNTDLILNDKLEIIN